jgi:hypothetical protein
MPRRQKLDIRLLYDNLKVSMIVIKRTGRYGRGFAANLAGGGMMIKVYQLLLKMS